MVAGKTSYKFAKSLAGACDGVEALRRLSEEVSAFAAAVRGSRELRQLLANPAFSAEERASVLAAIFDRCGFSAQGRDAATEVVRKGRLPQLDAIDAALRVLFEQRAGIRRAVAFTPFPLGKDGCKDLEARLATALGRQVVLEEKVDRDLIGGVKIRIGSLVVDATIGGLLRRMRQAAVSKD